MSSRPAARQTSSASSSASAATSTAQAQAQAQAQRFGPYLVGETIGRGSFAKVKRAIHEPTGTRVALKVISRKAVEADARARLKLRREIRVLRLLRHPHITRIYDVVQTRNDIVLVLELVSGGELFDYLARRGHLPEDHARVFFQQLLSAVAHCHNAGVVHRDIKPENILVESLPAVDASAEESSGPSSYVTRSQKQQPWYRGVKLGDFGLSSLTSDGKLFETSCGTPNYAAPEVVSGRVYVGREADVWSCGVVLFTMLAGALPFDDEHLSALFKKIQTATYTMPAHLSPAAQDLISRLLVVNPLDRATVSQALNHPWVRESFPPYLTLLYNDALAENCIFPHTFAEPRSLTARRANEPTPERDPNEGPPTTTGDPCTSDAADASPEAGEHEHERLRRRDMYRNLIDMEILVGLCERYGISSRAAMDVLISGETGAGFGESGNGRPRHTLIDKKLVDSADVVIASADLVLRDPMHDLRIAYSLQLDRKRNLELAAFRRGARGHASASGATTPDAPLSFGALGSLLFPNKAFLQPAVALQASAAGASPEAEARDGPKTDSFTEDQRRRIAGVMAMREGSPVTKALTAHHHVLGSGSALFPPAGGVLLPPPSPLPTNNNGSSSSDRKPSWRHVDPTASFQAASHGWGSLGPLAATPSTLPAADAGHASLLLAPASQEPRRPQQMLSMAASHLSPVPLPAVAMPSGPRAAHRHIISDAEYLSTYNAVCAPMGCPLRVAGRGGSLPPPAADEEPHFVSIAVTDTPADTSGQESSASAQTASSGPTRVMRRLGVLSPPPTMALASSSAVPDAAPPRAPAGEAPAGPARPRCCFHNGVLFRGQSAHQVMTAVYHVLRQQSYVWRPISTKSFHIAAVTSYAAPSATNAHTVTPSKVVLRIFRLDEPKHFIVDVRLSVRSVGNFASIDATSALIDALFAAANAAEARWPALSPALPPGPLLTPVQPGTGADAAVLLRKEGSFQHVPHSVSSTSSAPMPHEVQHDPAPPPEAAVLSHTTQVEGPAVPCHARDTTPPAEASAPTESSATTETMPTPAAIAVVVSSTADSASTASSEIASNGAPPAPHAQQSSASTEATPSQSSYAPPRRMASRVTSPYTASVLGVRFGPPSQLASASDHSASVGAVASPTEAGLLGAPAAAKAVKAALLADSGVADTVSPPPVNREEDAPVESPPDQEVNGQHTPVVKAGPIAEAEANNLSVPDAPDTSADTAEESA